MNIFQRGEELTTVYGSWSHVEERNKASILRGVLGWALRLTKVLGTGNIMPVGNLDTSEQGEKP